MTMIKIKCNECGKAFSIKNIKMLNGKPICNNCYEEYETRGRIRKCSSCGEEILDATMCDECSSRVYRKTVNGYSTKPRPIFRSKAIDKYSKPIKHDRYYGFELELNNVAPTIPRILFNDLYSDKLIYNKNDSSISRGTEIVTNPMDYTNINKLIDRMSSGLGEIKKLKVDTESNAGFHIHISRDSMLPMTIYKLSLLFNLNEGTADRKIMYYLSGRAKEYGVGVNDDYYSMGSGVGYSISKYIKKIKDNDLPRHIAINLLNKNTVEMRLFSSSINVDEIKSYIDICKLIIEYCNNISFKDMIMYIKYNTDNKLLISRINDIPSTDLDNTFANTMQIKDIVNKLKGINVKYYGTIINLIYDLKSNKEIYKTLIKNKLDENEYSLVYCDDKEVKIKNNLAKILYNTYDSYIKALVKKGTKICA